MPSFEPDPRASLVDRHRDRPYAFQLDHSGTDQPSFAGSNPTSVLVVDANGRARVGRDGSWHRADDDPVVAIAEYVENEQREPDQAPGFVADAALPRTVGYLAYELGAWIEPTVGRAPDPLGLPLAVLATYDQVDARDPKTGAVDTIRFESSGVTPPPKFPWQSDVAMGEATSTAAYVRGFERVQEAIAAGEIYQANLARRLRFQSDEAPTALFERLRADHPVPYGALLDYGAFALLSNSPECFLRICDDRIATFPIKGTYPRGSDAKDDAELRAQLTRDPKESAEHVMIVDLERNDLGRVCQIGSVGVKGRADVLTLESLHHLVSEVHGVLRPEVGLADILRATFPGGSITGAPKVQAMRVIREVEPQARGVYTGAIGCMNGARSVSLSIAIRTAVQVGSQLLFGAGGGIVADSVMDRELRETELKASAFRRALIRDHVTRAVG